VIAANYEQDRHRIGAAVRMRDGRVFPSIHVEARVGRVGALQSGSTATSTLALSTVSICELTRAMISRGFP
jgi:cytidine deaminase